MFYALNVNKGKCANCELKKNIHKVAKNTLFEKPTSFRLSTCVYLLNLSIITSTGVTDWLNIMTLA